MKISDEQILTMIEAGEIVVPLENPLQITVRGRAIKAYAIGKHAGNPQRTRYAFGLRIDGKRRTIVRSKLVWIAGSRRLVPPGFEIHHLDQDRYNDDWENLVALSPEDHDKFHGMSGHADALEFLDLF